ncbi:hypothetical protein BGZ83_006340 [Gryganskiella cystojenkinii]|nr:hypothetical protein BGZ83_006340 [Gryganskiella cystojenkinii]
MPTSHQPSLSGSQQLPSIGSSSTTHALSTPKEKEPTAVEQSKPLQAETKRRNWQSPKKALEASTLMSEVIKDDPVPGDDLSTNDSSVMSSINLFDSPVNQSSPSASGESTPKVNATTKTSQPKSSTFGLGAFSNPRSGIVSGLTSLKNSIMIPALSSNHPKTESAAPSQSSSLATSQSSLLDFVVSDQPSPRNSDDSHHYHHQHHQHHQHRKHDSVSSSTASSPFLVANPFLNSDDGASPRPTRAESSGRSAGSLDKKKQRILKEDYFGSEKSPKFRRSTFGLVSERRSSTTPLSPHQSRTRRTTSQNSSALSLSNLETGFQQLIRKQSQLSAHKIDLCRELISLYSRRNINEKRQGKAIAEEAFEEADAAATTIRLVQERIQKLEAIYAETDKALWETKKQQDELGQSIIQTHGAVMQEMDLMRQAREQEKKEYQEEFEQQRETEQTRIQTERQELHKAEDEVAERKKQLNEEQAKIAEQVGTETMIEQTEMSLLMDKRTKARTEIQELEKRLSDLRKQDRELSKGIDKFQQKIDVVAKRFEEQTTVLAGEQQHLERQGHEIQTRIQRLNQQDSHLKKIVDGTGSTQLEIAAEIENIVSQQTRLEDVRQQFASELTTIQKLRLEEEAFREKEASWTLRANSLAEDVRKQDKKLVDLTDRIANEQKGLTDLELEIESCQRRILKAESLKDLSVQRRDFKQASQCSSEINRHQASKKDLEGQLGSLSEKLRTPADYGLDALRQECDQIQRFVRGEEAILSKEIATTIAEALARLDVLGEDSNADDTLKTNRESGAENQTAAASTAGQLTRLLLSEIQSEIELFREMARIRFGREETVPSTSLSDGGSTAASEDTTAKDEEQVEVQRRKLERSIQAAVAEEDYDAAATLQAELDAL